MAEVLLYFADRAQHVAEVVRPALARRPHRASATATSTRAWRTRATGAACRSTRSARSARSRPGGLRPDADVLLDVPVDAGPAAGEPARRPGPAGGGGPRVPRAGARRLRRARRAEPERWVRVDARGAAEDVIEAVWRGLARARADPGSGGLRLADVLGHDRVRAVLARALERDRLPPALLLDGPDGVGKRTLALAVAQAALCERAPIAEPCGECLACRKVGSALRAERLAEMRPRPIAIRTRTLAQLPAASRPGARRGLVAHAHGAPAQRARDPRRPGARAGARDRGHPLRGAAPGLRDRRRPHDERLGAERALEEPGGAGFPLARDPGLVGGHGAAAHDPLALPAPALRAAAARDRERAAAARARPRRPRPRSCRPRWPAAAWRRRSRTIRAASCARATSSSRSSSACPAPTRSRAWRRPRRSSSRRISSSLLTTLRSLLRDLAALRAGAAPQALLNPDRADRLAALAAGPLGRARDPAGERGRGRPRGAQGLHGEAADLRSAGERARRRLSLAPGREPVCYLVAGEGGR